VLLLLPLLPLLPLLRPLLLLLLLLRSAADMAMSTSNDFVAAREKENAAAAVEETPIEWTLKTE
jgi:hypothetical protein